MKKTIILILAVLPIVLLVIIAFAGRILSVYQHIPVERVEFINEIGDPYTNTMFFKVNQGEEKDLSVRVYPELASNKKVSFTSNDESICTVDKDGKVTGVMIGTTSVLVKTDDGGKTALINIMVTADIPVDVELSEEEITLIEGQQFFLEATVEYPVALDKRVKFTSSDDSVATVDPIGRVTAQSVGTAIITVTTVSGERTDTCIVNVVPGNLPVSFELRDVEGITLTNGVYVLDNPEINLNDYLAVSGDFRLEDVKLQLISGSFAILEDGKLTFTRSGVVSVRAYIGDPNNPDAMIEIKIGHVFD